MLFLTLQNSLKSLKKSPKALFEERLHQEQQKFSTHSSKLKISWVNFNFGQRNLVIKKYHILGGANKKPTASKTFKVVNQWMSQQILRSRQCALFVTNNKYFQFEEVPLSFRKAGTIFRLSGDSQNAGIVLVLQVIFPVLSFNLSSAYKNRFLSFEFEFVY